MTPRQRLRRVQRRLIVAVGLTAVGWAGCVGVGVLLLLRALAIPLAAPLAVGGAILVFLAFGWRGRAVRSLEALALWVEEGDVDADYALVTLADPRTRESEALIAAAAATDIEGRATAAMHRLAVQALTACGLAGALWFAIGRPMNSSPPTGDSAAPPPVSLASRLTPLSVRVVAPAYSHLPPQSLHDPGTVDALAGSEVTVTGPGDGNGVSADSGAGSLTISSADDHWKTHLRMPVTPGVLRFRDRSYSRLVVLAPRIDSLPEVVLERPLHDTTYRVLPSTPILLEARATDDFGLARGYFEYLITVGGDESFTTTTRTSASQSLGNSRSTTLHAAIRLDTLHLTPGSVVSIRAIVFDGNDVTGPGKGLSETRTLRLAERADSSAVNAAPPDQVDSMLISQRLLNMRTDSLIRARARMVARTDFASRSMTHSNTQETIRQRVLTVIGVLEDDGVGGTAPTDVSKLLRVAADEMAAARIELALSSPPTAMPHMKKALAILDQVRLANRYYLRGRQPAVLVDIEKVRLKGEGTPGPAPLSPRGRLENVLATLSRRVEAAAALYASAPFAAQDSLTLVRVSALSLAPSVGRELGAALEALRRGAALDSALAPLRRVLSPAPVRLAGSAEWSGVPAP